MALRSAYGDSCHKVTPSTLIRKLSKRFSCFVFRRSNRNAAPEARKTVAQCGSTGYMKERGPAPQVRQRALMPRAPTSDCESWASFMLFQCREPSLGDLLVFMRFHA
jgi:hypothetical protein